MSGSTQLIMICNQCLIIIINFLKYVYSNLKFSSLKIASLGFDLNILVYDFYFCGGRGRNPGPCIYYALSLPTKLSS